MIGKTEILCSNLQATSGVAKDALLSTPGRTVELNAWVYQVHPYEAVPNLAMQEVKFDFFSGQINFLCA